jgi:hypothetical protein
MDPTAGCTVSREACSLRALKHENPSSTLEDVYSRGYVISWRLAVCVQGITLALGNSCYDPE